MSENVANYESARTRMMRLIQERDKVENELAELGAVLENNNVGMSEPLTDSEGYPRNDIDVYRVRLARHKIICLRNDYKDIMRKIERLLVEVHAENNPNRAHEHNPTDRPQNARMNGRHSPQQGRNISPAIMNGHVPPVVMNGHAPVLMNGYAPVMLNGHAPAMMNGHGPAMMNGHAPIMNGHAPAMMNGHISPVMNGHHDDSDEQDVTFAYVSFVSEGSPAETAGLRNGDELLQFGSINHENFRDMSQVHNLVAHSAGREIPVKVLRSHQVHSITLVPRQWGRPGLLGCQIQRRENL